MEFEPPLSAEETPPYDRLIVGVGSQQFHGHITEVNPPLFAELPDVGF